MKQKTVQTKTDACKTDAPITKDWTIGDLVQQFPACAEILTKAGVHCVGCGAAFYETIEQGLKGHGMTDAQVNTIVKDINAAIPKEMALKDELIITENAAEKLKEIIKQTAKEEGKSENSGLRIQVISGGCSGMQYKFDLAEKADSGDKVYEINGAKFMIDKESFEMLKGAKIDYIDSLSGAGFKISNPNAQKTCGCGQSFA